jgi:hypothetical protein
MVYMAVCVEQHFNGQAVAFDKVGQVMLLAGIVAARVDDDTFFRFVRQHIGIFLEGIKYEGMDFKHGQK